ncbi:hypothetical protein [Mesorhizobium xinjiangense]|uniref:hypothetical protein n=1 Tax=Mesorhizobium xinjiangense TaxID=2678685 RepID=UPI0012EE057D|nr:hypothetical protein [Mesorhizobium xinjiangense]
MYAHSLISGALLALAATSTSGAEPVIFHTSRFSDATTVDLSLVTRQLSVAADYDYDVTIGLTELGADGAQRYRDRGRHRARVRCGAPAGVLVGGTDYAVQPSALPYDPADWKRNLWRTVCEVPTS